MIAEKDTGNDNEPQPATMSNTPQIPNNAMLAPTSPLPIN